MWYDKIDQLRNRPCFYSRNSDRCRTEMYEIIPLQFVVHKVFSGLVFCCLFLPLLRPTIQSQSRVESLDCRDYIVRLDFPNEEKRTNQTQNREWTVARIWRWLDDDSKASFVSAVNPQFGFIKSTHGNGTKSTLSRGDRSESLRDLFMLFVLGRTHIMISDGRGSWNRSYVGQIYKKISWILE